jgi:hypothetical protein
VGLVTWQPATPPRPPGRPRTRQNVLEDAEFLVEWAGYSWHRPEHLAARLGMSKAAFVKAVYRARLDRQVSASGNESVAS